MQDDLREFLSRFVGTVVMTLVPVVLIAFLSMPLSLSRHPGEAPLVTGAPIELGTHGHGVVAGAGDVLGGH